MTLLLLLRTGGGVQTITAGQTSETETAQSVAPSKRRLVAQPTETDLAQPVTRLKTRNVGLLSEADQAQPTGRVKTLAAGQATEVDAAQAILKGGAPGVLSCKKGAFVLASTDTGTKQIRSVGFQGKVLLLWAGFAGAADETYVANAQLAVGLVDAAGAQAHVTIWDEDVVATSNAARHSGIDACIRGLITSGGTSAVQDFELDFSAWDADGFDLTITDAPAANRLIHYLVLGGTEITDSKVFSFTPSLTATQDIDVAVGFGQPDLCLLATGGISGLQTGAGFFGFGVFNKALQRAAAYLAVSDNVATMQGVSYLDAKAIGGPAVNGQDFVGDISPVANWPTDGFELTWDDQAAAANRLVVGVALKGTFQSKIALASSPTSAGNQDLDATFPPIASVFFSDDLPAHTTVDTTHADGHGLGLGAFDGTAQGLIDFQMDDAATDAVSKSVASDADVIRLTAPGSPPANNGIAVASYPAGNTVRLAWTGVGATARQFAWVAVGSAAAAGHTVAVGQVVETDLAQPVGRVKTVPVGQVSSTGVAQPIASRKTRGVTQAVETDLAQPVSHAGVKVIPVGQIVETDLAQPVRRIKVRTLTQPVETDLAQPVSRRKTRTLGQLAEIDLAQTVVARRIRRIPVGQAGDLSQAQLVQHLKTLHVGQALEIDAAQPVTRFVAVFAWSQIPGTLAPDTVGAVIGSPGSRAPSSPGGIR